MGIIIKKEKGRPASLFVCGNVRHERVESSPIQIKAKGERKRSWKTNEREIGFLFFSAAVERD